MGLHIWYIMLLYMRHSNDIGWYRIRTHIYIYIFIYIYIYLGLWYATFWDIWESRNLWDFWCYRMIKIRCGGFLPSWAWFCCWKRMNSCDYWGILIFNCEPFPMEDASIQIIVKTNACWEWLTLAGWWFQPTPLKKMSSSVGMMKFPIWWKHKTCSKPPTSH